MHYIAIYLLLQLKYVTEEKSSNEKDRIRHSAPLLLFEWVNNINWSIPPMIMSILFEEICTEGRTNTSLVYKW